MAQSDTIAELSTDNNDHHTERPSDGDVNVQLQLLNEVMSKQTEDYEDYEKQIADLKAEVLLPIDVSWEPNNDIEAE